MHDWAALVRARLARCHAASPLADDVVDEIAQHVAQHHAELVASGAADLEAVERALAPLDAHGASLIREVGAARPARPAAVVPPPARARVVEAIVRDLAYSARLLARSKGFTFAAVLTLAIGVGANTAIFSIVNAVLLRPLPFADPERLVTLGEATPNGTAGNVGYQTFLDWKHQARGFAEMAVIRSWNPTLVASGEPERIAALRVSANYFRMLGITPALGRDFLDEEDTPARWRVVIISDGLWKRRFNGEPSVVGRVLSMNGQHYTIVGVLPPTFEPLISARFYQRADMWALVGYDASLTSACRTCRHMKALGRLKPGVSLDAARADVEAVQQRLVAAYPSEYTADPMAVVPLRQELTGDIRPALLALMGAVALVLLIACANVANLQLARIAERRRDLALRTALGAPRGRIVSQLLAESGLVAAAGAILGTVSALLLLPALTALAPGEIADRLAIGFDAHLLWFTLAITAATAVVFGLAPALRAAAIDETMPSLQGNARRTAAAATTLGRRALIATDVAVAMVLLAAAGLMIRSVASLLGVDPGFDPAHVLSMQISMVGGAYAEDSAVVSTGDAILDKLRRLPGVEAVALAGQVPLGGNGDRWSLRIEGRPFGPDDPDVERYSVTPDYFTAMRIPLLRGRLIEDRDRPGGENVMLIGERTARTLFPATDPIGQHAKIGGDPSPWRTIVGIVGDVHHEALSAPTTMQMYTPQAQLTDSFLTVVIRGGADAAILANEARRAIWSVAPDVPVYEVAPLERLVERSVAPRRFIELLLELFAATALVMTSVGVYGLVAASVSERTREIGIRSALGASRRMIAGLVLRAGFAVVAVGLLAGSIAALAATRYLRGSLYGVSAADPRTFAAVMAVLVLVAMVAHVVPLARALRVDPAVALRHD